MFVMTRRGRFQGFIPAAAFWRGPPSQERVKHLQKTHFFDSENHFKGGHGSMYSLDEETKKWRKMW